MDHCKLEAGDDWTVAQKAGSVVLTPAACYPLYPIIARRGRLPSSGVTVALSSYCFRHEPSKDPTRMQMFRMREFVRIGAPDEVQNFRQRWIERSRKLAEMLMLANTVEIANDQFFGRCGTIMANSQREQALKLELLVPVSSREHPTACISFNYHQEHFSKAWDILCSNGARAHTACVGFGLERIGLALFRHHGFDIAAWPRSVRACLRSDV
jgi:seryl-tRNA synthetase